MSTVLKGNHQHLTLSDRIYIEQGLEGRMKFKDIAIFIAKDPTTISKEIRRHRIEHSQDRLTSLCIHRETCAKTNICSSFCGKKLCGKCTQRHCHRNCPVYRATSCPRLAHAPYVCNGCGQRSCRQNTKYYYRAQYADQSYHEELSSSRSGVNKTPLELDNLDRIVSPLLQQGQPLGHIFATHGAELGCSRPSLYHYINQGIFSARNIDLPRKVRYKPHKTRRPLGQTIPLRDFHKEW